MKKYIIFLSVLFYQQSVFTQTLDVDRLYAKYKDKESITLYNAGESFTANIKIEYNEKDKPSSVILYGSFFSSAQSSAIDNIIKDLEVQKEKVGYKYTGITRVYIPFQAGESIMVSVYQKGSQFAKYGRSSVLDIMKRGTSDWFYFEVGDSKRKANDKGEKFEF